MPILPTVKVVQVVIDLIVQQLLRTNKRRRQTCINSILARVRFSSANLQFMLDLVKFSNIEVASTTLVDFVSDEVLFDLRSCQI